MRKSTWRIRENLIEWGRRLLDFLSVTWDRFHRDSLPWMRDRMQGGAVFLGPRWKKYAVIGALVGMILGGGYFLIVFTNYLIDRSDIIADLEEQQQWLAGLGVDEKKPPIRIHASDGSLIGEYIPERGSRMTLRECGTMTWLNTATVASEDREFFEHGGISYRGIARAMYTNITSLSLTQGGGSITQQLARNLYTNRERTLYRKIYETLVAFLIEDHLSKDEILCLYLNKIYMGEGRIGAEEAAWFYFRKPPQDLDAAEAAMIVGLYPSPVYYSPLNNIELSLRKQEIVMNALESQEHLTTAERNLAMQRFLRRYEVDTGGEEADPGLIGRYGADRDFRYNLAPAVNAYVKDFLWHWFPDEEGEQLIRNGGLEVHTTIDLRRQRQALASVRSYVDSMRATMLANTKADPELLRKQARRTNGVMVSLAAESGDVLAMVGGYAISEGNMASRIFAMRRQPGSTVKGFLYAVAMDDGVLDVNSIVNDRRPNIRGYSPRNWDGVYLGKIPLRVAVAKSINSVAVATLDDLGVSYFRAMMLDAIPTLPFELYPAPDPSDRFPRNLTLALGSGELSPMELARIYAAVNNGGFVVHPRIITEIKSEDGEVVYLSEPPDRDRLLSEEAADKAVKLMTYVFERDPAGREQSEDWDPRLARGTAMFIGDRRRRDESYLPFDIAGKTGTVQNYPGTNERFPFMAVDGSAHDAWFVGLAPGETTVVWFGNDEGAPVQSSGPAAAGVWASYAQGALRGRVAGSFEDIEIEDEEERGDDFFRFWDDDEDEGGITIEPEDREDPASEDENNDTNPEIDPETPQDSPGDNRETPDSTNETPTEPAPNRNDAGETTDTTASREDGVTQ